MSELLDLLGFLDEDERKNLCGIGFLYFFFQSGGELQKLIDIFLDVFLVRLEDAIDGNFWRWGFVLLVACVGDSRRGILFESGGSWPSNGQQTDGAKQSDKFASCRIQESLQFRRTRTAS